MPFDFRANQVRLNRVISSGSLPILVYPSSSAGDFAGGLHPTFSTASIGTDTFLFVSGNEASRSVFGGGVTVSGSLLVRGGLTASISGTVDGLPFIVGQGIVSGTYYNSSTGQWFVSGNVDIFSASIADALDNKLPGYVNSGLWKQYAAYQDLSSNGLEICDNGLADRRVAVKAWSSSELQFGGGASDTNAWSTVWFQAGDSSIGFNFGTTRDTNQVWARFNYDRITFRRPLRLSHTTGGPYADFLTDTLTTNRTLRLPDEDGTLITEAAVVALITSSSGGGGTYTAGNGLTLSAGNVFGVHVSSSATNVLLSGSGGIGIVEATSSIRGTQSPTDFNKLAVLADNSLFTSSQTVDNNVFGFELGTQPINSLWRVHFLSFHTDIVDTLNSSVCEGGFALVRSSSGNSALIGNLEMVHQFGTGTVTGSNLVPYAGALGVNSLTVTGVFGSTINHTFKLLINEHRFNFV